MNYKTQARQNIMAYKSINPQNTTTALLEQRTKKAVP
jgi:hypothetical protein